MPGWVLRVGAVDRLSSCSQHLSEAGFGLRQLLQKGLLAASRWPLVASDLTPCVRGQDYQKGDNLYERAGLVRWRKRGRVVQEAQGNTPLFALVLRNVTADTLHC